MLTSSRRSLNGARQDDVVYTAEPVEADDIFDAETYDLPTPTFFAQAFREIPVSRLADRYRSARDVSPMPDVVSRRPGQSRPLAHYPIRAARYTRELEEAFHPSEDIRRRPTAVPQTEAQSRPTHRPQAALFVAAGVLAIVIGGGFGYLTTRLGHGSVQAGPTLTAALAAPVVNATTETAVPARPAASGRKPITMAKLDVADASGSLNSLIPLALHADETGISENILLKLSGLPKSAYLTAGARLNDSDWQLAAADAVGVKLVVPRTDAPSFKVGVTALESKSGEMVAPPQEMTIAITGATVVPASAPPETAVKVSAPGANSEAATSIPAPSQQQAAAGPASEAQNLIGKGDILLKSGDLVMARQFYERAFAEGARAAAALGTAKTFDPVVYAQLKVQGLQPDPQQALEWYERAKAEGSPDAGPAIDALKKTAP